jgi:hypothetical protein
MYGSLNSLNFAALGNTTDLQMVRNIPTLQLKEIKRGLILEEQA